MNSKRAVGIIPIAKPKLSKKQQLKTPSLRFPLPAGGTEQARGLVPLAKRGEP